MLKCAKTDNFDENTELQENGHSFCKIVLLCSMTWICNCVTRFAKRWESKSKTICPLVLFLLSHFVILFFFCQWTNWQCANHTISKEKGGDYRAMASSQGVLSEGWKREKGRGLTVGWCGGECHGVFLQQLSMSAHPPVLSGWGTVMCVSKTVCRWKVSQFVGDDMWC